MKRSTFKKTSIGMIVFQVVVTLFVITCWVINLVKFTQCDFKEPYKAEIIHGVGLTPGISIVTAWFPSDTPAKK